MKKLAISLICITMFISACGNRADKDRVQPVVTESVKILLETEKESNVIIQESSNANIEIEKDTGLANKESELEDTTLVFENGGSKTEDREDNTMKITAGDTIFTATLADNSSVDALKELLAKGPLTINMRDYASMEKVGPIGTDLPRNDEQISTGAGDIILYQGNSLVIYYNTNSWNFTRIGKIEGVTGEDILDAFGDGDVTVTFSLE